MGNEPFNEGDGRGFGNGNTKVDKAKAQCETQLTRLWVKQEVEHCGKLGSWKRRINALNNSIFIMQRMCAKRKYGRIVEEVEEREDLEMAERRQWVKDRPFPGTEY